MRLFVLSLLLAIRSPVLTGAGACGAFLLLEDGMPLRPTGFCNVNQLFEANTSQAAAIEADAAQAQKDIDQRTYDKLKHYLVFLEAQFNAQPAGVA